LVGAIGRYSKSPFPEKSLEQLTQLLVSLPREEPMTTRSGVQFLQPRNVRRRLGDEVIQQLASEYEAGDTTLVLMERYGLSKTAVLKVLRDNDVVIRRQPLTQEQVSEAIRLYTSGSSLARVASQMSLPSESIRRALDSAGVKRR